MKKIRVVALLLLASLDLADICAAQNKPQYPYVSGAPDCILVPSGPFTAIGDSVVYDNRNQGCTTWTLVYNSQGFSALNISFKSADDSGNGPGAFTNWGTSGGILATGTTLPLSVTTSGQATGYTYRPFVKISITSVTGSGSIWPMLYGYRSGPSGNSALGVPQMDSQARIVISGPGSTNGLAQSLAVFSMPNTASGSVCCATTPLVIPALTTATNVKASSGALYYLAATNTNATVCYIQAFDVVQGSVTLGTTVPKFVLGLGAAVGATNFATMTPMGLYFGTGISVAATTTPTGAATCATGVHVSAIAQ